MPFSAGIVFIATGLGVMLFGLLLFYAFLPLLFAIIGFDIGVLLGRWLTGEFGVIAIALGIFAGGALALASYVLEPYRRILLGCSNGMLVGLALAAGLGLEGWLSGFFNVLLALVAGVIGGFLVLHLFDAFVIVSSALGGASLVVAGAQLLLHGGIQGGIGEFWPSLTIIVLAALGISWQLSKASKWMQWLPVPLDASGDSSGDRERTPKA